MKKGTKEIVRKEVNRSWEMFEKDEPDISTERLMQMVADHVNMVFGVRLQASDVLDYLDQD